jgi:hypothetical protein
VAEAAAALGRPGPRAWRAETRLVAAGLARMAGNRAQARQSVL